MNEFKDEEEKKKHHESVKKFLQIAGILALAIGIIFVIIGFADFFKSFGTFDMPTKFWCLFVGFPLCAAGGGLLSLGFKKEISRYMKNETMPVIKEASDEIKPAVMNIAAAARAGLKSDKILCKCGELNSNDSKFCKKCGASLRKNCPSCKALLDSNSRFCDSCGHKL